MTDIAIKIWHLSPSNTPRMVWLLTNTFLALASLGLTLLDLPRFLVDAEYRQQLVPHIQIKAAQDFFLYEFPKSEGAIHQWVTPVLNKLGGLLFDPDIRLMFGSASTINFRSVLDQGLILLVNLPKGILGEATSSLLAAFIVAHLQKAALSRANAANRSPFYLYLDEFQHYTTDNIKDILSEARKYALSLTLVHQYLDQLSTDLRSAVLNTAGTMVSFRVGYHDAYQLAKEIFPSPDFITTHSTKVRFGRSGMLPIPILGSRRDPLGWDGLALELSKLKLREFWTRRRGAFPPVKQKTFNMPDPVLDLELEARLQALRDLSGKTHGQSRQIISRQATEEQHTLHNFDISPWTF